MSKMKFAVAIALLLANIVCCLKLAQAQNIFPVNVAAESQKRPPVGKPSGERTKPAGTRGPCEETDTPLTPLLPDTSSGFSGLTLNAHPIFWFYVPYKTNTVNYGKFEIEDPDEKIFYRTSFKLPKTPGFVSVSIPTEKALEVNKQYRWHFFIYCASNKSSEPNFVSHEGAVQRVALPSLENQLRTAKFGERITLYAANQIWYDAPTNLAEIRRRPEDWASLLKATGLEKLEQEPITGSVLPIEK